MTLMAPLDVDVLAPDVTETDLPDAVVEVVPPTMTTSPPAVASVDPAPTVTVPAAPPRALPLCKLTAPVTPSVVVPLRTVTTPLSPAEPPSELPATNAPLLDTVLAPLSTAISPPTPAFAAPPATVAAPPLSLDWDPVDAPPATSTDPPLPVDELAPPDNVELPPFADDALLLPAVTVTTPPLPTAPAPTPTVIAPPAPVLDAPLDSMMPPLAPADGVPVLNTTLPLTPLAPLAPLATVTSPLDVALLAPDVKAMAPPDALADVTPPVNETLPPTQPWGHRMLISGGLKPIKPGPIADNPPALAPAGGVHCDFKSWLKFLTLYLTPGVENTLIKPDTFDGLLAPSEGGRYGGGWRRVYREWGDGLVLYHAGTNKRFYSVAWLAPEKAAMVLVAVNLYYDGIEAKVDALVGSLIRYYIQDHYALLD